MEKINSPFENLIQIYIVEKREGFCKIGLSYRKELTNPHANFHGGVITAIVDTATVQSLRTIFPEGPYLTVDLAIRYKMPSNASEIFAEAKPAHLKGNFFKTDVRVIDNQNKLIAEAQVKSFLPNFKQNKAKESI